MSKLQTSQGMLVFAGNSHPALANLVASHMNLTLGKTVVFNKTNRESYVEINETVRGKDVFIIQTGTKNVNNDIMELLVMVYACRTSSARNITVVMPYLPYCKQSKMRKRGCIVGRLLASMLIKAGMSRMITMDLHAKEIQGFYDRPVENLRASPFLIQYIVDNVQDYRNAVIVARNPSAVNRATSFAERLRLSIAVIHGVEKAESEQDDGRASPPPLGGKPSGPVLLEKRPKQRIEDPASGLSLLGESNSIVGDTDIRPSASGRIRQLSTSSLQAFHMGLEFMPMNKAKDKPPMNVVGDVSGRIAIIVDDMIDDVDQFVTAAELLYERGAYKVMVMATHGILSSDASRKLDDSRIDEIVVTNTVPHEIQKMQCHKIKTVDVSVLIAEAIRRITYNESMSYLFTNISVHD